MKECSLKNKCQMKRSEGNPLMICKQERFECLHISLTELTWIHRKIPNFGHGKEFRDS